MNYFNAISQEEAREHEKQQAESLRNELKLLSYPKDKQRIAVIESRLKAIQELANNS